MDVWQQTVGEYVEAEFRKQLFPEGGHLTVGAINAAKDSMRPAAQHRYRELMARHWAGCANPKPLPDGRCAGHAGGQ